ncbi:MAG: putative Fe-S cluster assembly protein SufT [Verrucomicrobia bacterium]|nr:putative Fe-S cluster assembly protein SufT [Verrucomicrobiota bacterium]
MQSNSPVILARDVEATLVPAGTPVTLQKGQSARITQFRDGAYTVAANEHLFRIDGRNADALGLAPAPAAPSGDVPATAEAVRQAAWAALKKVFDPEIPLNIVDLGLVYDCQVGPGAGPGRYKVHVKMTLTAPGCPMGPMIAQDARNRLLEIPAVDEADVDLVWDPPWSQTMLSEAAKLQLGLL